MRKFSAEQMKNKKLKQFRSKYLSSNVFLYLCQECKRYSMMLHSESCIFCCASNIFFQPDLHVDESLMGQLTEDILMLESADADDILPMAS